jgi:hypothetical protein
MGIITKINKVLNNIKKNTKQLSTKTVIIGFIVLAICFVFIVSNGMEYNLFNKPRIVDSFENSTLLLKAYSVIFDKNNEITKSGKNVIYYNEFDRDLILKKITLELLSNYNLDYLKDKNNIDEFYIQDSKLNKYNLNDYNISSANNDSIIIDCKNKNLNLHIDPMIKGDNNKFSLVIIYKNTIEVVIPFKVGEKRFRINNKIVENDNINLVIFNESTNRTSSIINQLGKKTTNIELQQFNKIIFKIEKPNIQEIRKNINSTFISDQHPDFMEKIKKFDSFIPYKFLINVSKNTNNNKSASIEPKYSIPNEGSLCLEGNEKFLLVNNVACKLTLHNILPEEKYTVSVLIEYRDINDIDNSRYSDKYELTFMAKDNKNPENSYDLITPTLKGINKFNFTNKMIAMLDQQNKFSTEQKTQDNELTKLETELESSLTSRNI